jgi:hypothetical protein
MTPKELSRLVDAERAVRAPSGAADAGLDRLVSALGDRAAALPVASGPLKIGLSALPKWVGVGFLIGATGAGIASHAPAPAPSSFARPSVTVALPAVTSCVAVEHVPGTPPVSAAASASPAPLARQNAAAASPSAVANSPPTFDQELQLIAAAKREMDAGRPHLALAWLDEHRAQFPAGVFAMDREALNILARCQQRKQPELARSFVSKHPGSPLTAQLIERCDDSGTVFSEPSNVPAAPGEPTQ